MSKLDSLRFLERKGLNIHNYKVVDNLLYLAGYCQVYVNSSIRFDRESNELQLPFVLVDRDTFDRSFLSDVLNLSRKLGCYLIISDGRNYDQYLKYNLVVMFDRQGNFNCNLSTLKIPLRHMYNHKLMQVTGNIKDYTKDWEVWGERQTDLDSLRKSIETLYSKEIFNKYLECSFYTRRVGIYNEDHVFWHIN